MRYLNVKMVGAVAVLFTAGQALAQQQQQNTRFRGSVVTVGVNGSSFVVSDNNGTNTNVKTDGYTQFQMDRQPSTWSEVLKAGQTVTGYIKPDGAAVMVSARSPRLSYEDQIGKALGSTDEEWDIIKPRLVAVMDKQRALDEINKPVRINDLDEPPMTNGEVRVDLQALRQQRASAESDLAAARRDLVELMTMKQEWILVQLGILE